VGAFGAAISNIEKYGLVDTIKKVVFNGKPLLGICLGLQMLFEESDELGSYKGLGIIKGNVPRFSQEELRNISNNKLKVPHMGWNSIKIEKKSPLFNNIPDNSMVYFVHSYYVNPTEDVISTKTNHGITFCSSIWKNNIFATQFHPEKSGKIGLAMLKNFAEV
ncbi:MAG: imidazole glycerol phosphate synthase subunit HisH, partial [Armatimonadota bacterium]